MNLKPFFSFYGSKYRIAPKYPPPDFDTIVEPFAGSAGYSALYPSKNVVLYDKDPIIASLWDYLISAPEQEIIDLPNIQGDDSVDAMNIPSEAKSLIGFWINRGSARPSKTRSAWMRAGNHDTSFWGKEIKERIASQQKHIRHWQVRCCDYSDIDNEQATWFIDPPYNNKAGSHYKMTAKAIDYQHLAGWCRGRMGQGIVCENNGADWLPFRHLTNAKANESSRGGKVSKESIWTNEQTKEST